MQSLKLFSTVIFSACLLFACSGNNSDKVTAANQSESCNVSSPDASFSVNVDDTTISGHSTGDMQLNILRNSRLQSFPQLIFITEKEGRTILFDKKVTKGN